ncbi:MAG: AAA family ATPase [Planctomycetes bacterium]|nr:AAA family ATPase [Planctomycetota bacterium]
MIPTISHWIGQDDAIRRFKVALEASWNDGTKLPHMLFCGSSGTGKTLLANLAAKEIGVQLHERIAQVMNLPGALNGLLLQAKDKEIIFLDEIHELIPPAQTLLYRAMEGGQISVRTGIDQTLNMPLKDFTIIGATTDEYRLLSPLRQRFKLSIPFSTYDEESLAKITLQRAQLMKLNIEPEIATQIAKRSRGVPRLAIRLLESCQRFARSLGDESVTMRHFEETVVLDGIDELGLAADDQKIVNFLTIQSGNPVRLFTLEAATGIHRRTIQEVIEPFLIRMGLIERTPQGRVITERGIRHVEGALQAEPVSERTS